MKVCTKCEKEKDHSDFNKSSRSPDGFHPQCRECAKEKKRLWREANRAHVRAQHKQWRDENREHVNERSRQYYRDNPEKVKKIKSDWRKRNASKVNSYTAKRHARKLSQTPRLTPEEKKQIEDLYWLARDLRAVSGEQYHVDHIHPLSKGGLHHPDNLQILPADINTKKNGREVKWQEAR